MSLTLVTLVSRAVKLCYPIIPVIESVLSIVDQIVVNVDLNGIQDGTVELIQESLAERGAIFRTKIMLRSWNWKAHDHGREFVRQTNDAFEFCTTDWILNLQADEVVHEDDLDEIRWLMTLPDDYAGAQLNRLYFYRDLQTVRTDWTQPLVRLIRRGKGRSVGDSMQCEADGAVWPYAEGGVRLFHYSRIGDAAIIGQRIYANDLMHHHPEELDLPKPYDFRLKSIDGHLSGRDASLPTLDPSLLVPFEGTHPKVMEGWKLS